MEHNEPVGTFLARVCDAKSDLHEGRLDLGLTLITVFVLNWLGNKFQPIRQSFYMYGKKHGQLSVDKTRDQYVAYKMALELEGNTGLLAASAVEIEMRHQLLIRPRSGIPRTLR